MYILLKLSVRYLEIAIFCTIPTMGLILKLLTNITTATVLHNCDYFTCSATRIIMKITKQCQGKLKLIMLQPKKPTGAKKPRNKPGNQNCHRTTCEFLPSLHVFNCSSHFICFLLQLANKFSLVL